jgi:short-subunit dehydrogenase
VGYIAMQCEWDDSDARDVLAESGLRCPRFSAYAWRLWDYYVRFMDRSLDKKQALRDEVSGKTVLITGSSDGIGLALAKRLAKENAHVILVARSLDKLKEVKKEVEAQGGSASVYSADLSEEASTNAMIAAVIKDHGDIDILVNNAGRSIRRSVEYQYDRFHDFARTIDLNYYGSLRCILGFLPGMRKRKVGQIINISSIGCITNAPRFGAYVASKAALDAFSRVISSEVDGDGVCISTVYMGLVATKMVVSKGNEYDRSDLLTTDQASEMIERAIVTKERRIDTDVGRWVSIAYFLFPSLTESLLHLTYSLEPEAPPQGAQESAAASGDKAQLKAVRNLMRGAF